MEYLQAKISWERQRKREEKKNRSNKFVPGPQQKIPKKIAKKFKKLKNTIMASLQAKKSWQRQRKREEKKNRSNKFLPDP